MELYRDFPSFDVFMMVENTGSHSPKSAIGVQLGSDVVTMKAIVCGLHRFHPHQTVQRAFVPCEWGYCHPHDICDTDINNLAMLIFPFFQEARNELSADLS